jgi:hypothetical protein
MGHALTTPLLPQRIPEPELESIELTEISNWHNVDLADPPSTSGHGPGPPPTTEENEAVAPPPPDLGSQKGPENEVDPGTPPSPDNEPADIQAATYAAKGKAKVSRTVRDVGNAAQREMHPAERSLDSEE